MYVLGNLLGSISQGYAASGLATSAAHAQAMNAQTNSQMAYMQSAMQGQTNLYSQAAYSGNAMRNAYAPPPEPVKANWAEAVQPTEHELELMRWDENLAALKKKTAEMHAEIKARIFPSSSD